MYTHAHMYNLHARARNTHKHIHEFEHTYLLKQGLDLEVQLCPQIQSRLGDVAPSKYSQCPPQTTIPLFSPRLVSELVLGKR